MIKKFACLALLAVSVQANAGVWDYIYATFHKEARWRDEGKTNMPPLEVNPSTAKCVVDENHRVHLKDGGRTLYSFNPRGTEAMSEEIYLMCGQALLRARRNIRPDQTTIKIAWVEFVNDRKFWDPKKDEPMVVEKSKAVIEASPFSSTRQVVAIDGIQAFPLNRNLGRDVRFIDSPKENEYRCVLLGEGCKVSQAPSAPSVTASAEQ